MSHHTPEFSRLHFFMSDAADTGPDSTLVIKGFSGAEEIQRFMDAMLEAGIFKPKEEVKQ